MKILLLDVILAIIGGTSFLLGGIVKPLIDDRIESRVDKKVLLNQLDFILLLEACAASSASCLLLILIFPKNPTFIVSMLLAGVLGVLLSSRLALAGPRSFAKWPKGIKLIFRLLPVAVLVVKGFSMPSSIPKPPEKAITHLSSTQMTLVSDSRS